MCEYCAERYVRVARIQGMHSGTRSGRAHACKVRENYVKGCRGAGARLERTSIPLALLDCPSSMAWSEEHAGKHAIADAILGCHLRHTTPLSGQSRVRWPALAGGCDAHRRSRRCDAHRRSRLLAPLLDLMQRRHTLHSSRSDNSMGEAPSTA